MILTPDAITGLYLFKMREVGIGALSVERLHFIFRTLTSPVWVCSMELRSFLRDTGLTRLVRIKCYLD